MQLNPTTQRSSRQLRCVSRALQCLSISTTLLCLTLVGPSFAQVPGPPAYTIQQFLYKNITTDATTLVKSGSGVLHSICINTTAATETITIYDALTAVAPKIATITLAAGDEGKCFVYDIVFSTGLTIVTAVAAGDLTVSSL